MREPDFELPAGCGWNLWICDETHLPRNVPHLHTGKYDSDGDELILVVLPIKEKRNASRFETSEFPAPTVG